MIGQYSQELQILVGPSGSGKSSYCQEHATNNPGVMIVSCDQIRTMLFGGVYVFKHNVEPLVKNIEILSTISCIDKGYSVINDEINLTKKRRVEFIEQIFNVFGPTTTKLTITAVVFPFGDYCFERRKNEPKGLKPEVWEKIIKEQIACFELPELSEGFSRIITMPYPNEKPKITEHEQAINNQQFYCSKTKNPLLIPTNGICPWCKYPIFGNLHLRSMAAKMHITYCPNCNHSFCN